MDDSDFNDVTLKIDPDSKFETRFLLPSKVVGSLIGKAGANIKRLRTQYNANVSIPDSQGPERLSIIPLYIYYLPLRVLTITSNLENLCQLVEDIIPGINEVLGVEEVQGKRRTELKLLIHQSQAGCIIGKAGQKIKELREITGCGIKIYSTCCPQSSDRVTLMMGNAPLISSCVKEVYNLLLESPPKGFVTNYNAENYDDFFAGEYGGYTMSEGAGNNPRNRGNRNSGGGGGGGDNGHSFRMNQHNSPNGGSSSGKPRGQFESQDRYNSNQFNDTEFVSNSYGRPGNFNANNSHNRPGNNGNSRSSGGMEQNSRHYDSSPYKRNYSSSTGNPELDNQFSSRGNNDSGEKSTTQVSIPKELAGAIIGKGGSRIRQIRNDSGASITIDEPLPGSCDRIISITGSSESIKNAQYLLQMSAGSAMKSNRNAMD